MVLFTAVEVTVVPTFTLCVRALLFQGIMTMGKGATVGSDEEP